MLLHRSARKGILAVAESVLQKPNIHGLLRGAAGKD
jgi:hypothetical protein